MKINHLVFISVSRNKPLGHVRNVHNSKLLKLFISTTEGNVTSEMEWQKTVSRRSDFMRSDSPVMWVSDNALCLQWKALKWDLYPPYPIPLEVILGLEMRSCWGLCWAVLNIRFCRKPIYLQHPDNRHNNERYSLQLRDTSVGFHFYLNYSHSIYWLNAKNKSLDSVKYVIGGFYFIGY